jgi:hypothetical protein
MSLARDFASARIIAVVPERLVGHAVATVSRKEAMCD